MMSMPAEDDGYDTAIFLFPAHRPTTKKIKTPPLVRVLRNNRRDVKGSEFHVVLVMTACDCWGAACFLGIGASGFHQSQVSKGEVISTHPYLVVSLQ